MKVMDIIFIGMLFIMTISVLNHGHEVLKLRVEEVYKVCKEK
jgi:hypothetical protein